MPTTVVVVCPICRGPLTKTSTIEKPYFTEVRAKCVGCGGHVVILATATKLEAFAAEYITPAVGALVDVNTEPLSAKSNHSINGKPCYGCDLCITTTGSHNVG